MKTNRFTLLAISTLLGTASAIAQPSFTPTGVIDMIPTSMSDDASIVVGLGTFGTPNLYYTEAGGATIIGDGCPSGLPAISGDGTTIVGCNVNSDGKWNAAKWLGGTSWLDLGTVDGGVSCDFFLSGSWGLTHDGSLAVGLVYLQQLCKASAGTWDLINGGPATALPKFFADAATRANAVNADGSVVVGWQDSRRGSRAAAKWVNGVEEFILTPSGGYNGEALAVSADGNTIVGLGFNFGRGAWIWSSVGGVKRIGKADGSESIFLTDVSDDGQTAVGFARPERLERAVIWRQGKGLITLVQYLRDRGVEVPFGWRMNVASLISADGKTIYGWGFNLNDQVEMFKAELR